jgi:hypothetical protein
MRAARQDNPEDSMKKRTCTPFFGKRETIRSYPYNGPMRKHEHGRPLERSEIQTANTNRVTRKFLRITHRQQKRLRMRTLRKAHVS